MRRAVTVARRQQGMVLVIGLLILLVMTILGVAAMQSTSMQERMAGSAQDRNRALQAAETALNVAERWIASNDEPFTPIQRAAFTANGSYGNYKGLYDAAVTMDAAQAAGNAVAINTDPDGGGVAAAIDPLPDVAAQPVYMIQFVSTGNCSGTESVTIYRVTARGWGRNPATRVTLVADVTNRTSCGAGGGSGGGFNTGGDNDSII